jgi:Protein phosphatase 2C
MLLGVVCALARENSHIRITDGTSLADDTIALVKADEEAQNAAANLISTLAQRWTVLSGQPDSSAVGRPADRSTQEYQALTQVGVDKPAPRLETRIEVQKPTGEPSHMMIEKKKPQIPAQGSPSTAPTLFPLAEGPKPVFSVDNARQGEPFSSQLRVTSTSDVLVTSIGVPEDLGLTFDPSTQRLSGLPLKAGDHDLVVSYSYAKRAERHPQLIQGTLRLVINPDPRSLWKSIPSRTEDPFWKPEEESYPPPGSPSRGIVAASKRGRSHAHAGSFRDDHFCCSEEGDWKLLAMADGAGSAARSRWGSKLACDAAMGALRQHLLGESGRDFLDTSTEWNADGFALGAGRERGYNLMGAAVVAAWNVVVKHAREEAAPVRDYATTLMLLAKSTTPGGTLVLSYSVGDGILAACPPGFPPELLAKPDSGEFAGQTRFLDGALIDPDDLASRIQMRLYRDPAPVLYAMTDGVGDPKFESDAKLASPAEWARFHDSLAPVFGAVDPGRELLKWLDFWSQGNHDDRTIAVIS